MDIPRAKAIEKDTLRTDTHLFHKTISDFEFIITVRYILILIRYNAVVHGDSALYFRIEMKTARTSIFTELITNIYKMPHQE